MIKLTALHKYFNKGRQNEIHVINDVSLELPERGMVAIFGKSGCGKTTLLNVIGGLDGFLSGSLTIDGQDIRKDTDALRNRYIGYIFQNYNLNKGETCYDNVADALRLCGVTDSETLDARVMAALQSVGMEKYSKRPPDTLSGGQQQRIAIARAIVKNPRIILADEPTGNLDEANTVLIMDLLKQIAKNHLVLLVTHEANLVDYYCDTVIELADGRVAGIRENTDANGYTARDKNTVYLGELEKRELADADAAVAYYGDAPAEPVRLKIVNHGGKLYVKLETPGVQVLDAFSELRLREGIYEQKKLEADVGQIDMSQLPPVEGKRFGRLFSFRSSIKSGYAANFKHRKKSKKLLRRCMGLFAAVVVFMSALFGTGIAQWTDAERSYNHNVFYVYTPDDGAVSEKLQQALADPKNGIDYLRLSYEVPNGDVNFQFNIGYFESFTQITYYGESFSTNAVLLDMELGENLTLVEGKKTELAAEEAVITTRVADELLEKSSMGYITEYRDLLGLISNRYMINGATLRIAGIVHADEPAVYLSREGMARYVLQSSELSVKPAADFGIELAAGETLLISTGEVGREHPKTGEQVQIHGQSLTLREVRTKCDAYEDWLKEKKLTKRARRQGETKASYWKYYYEELDAFLRDYRQLGGDNLDSWLYVEKGIALARFGILQNEEAYYAWSYEELNGREPTDAQLITAMKELPEYNMAISSARNTYEQEYSSTVSGRNIYTDTYLLSIEDYIAISRVRGKTDPCATLYGMLAPSVKEAAVDVYDEGGYHVMVESVDGGAVYTVVHSADPEATAAWLERELPELSTGVSYLPSILTPDAVYARLMSNISEGIAVSLVSLGVVLILMCLCMYFIMRSSLMNRIKEVGIYRAIGVSKKNLVFKFFIEALVLTTLTVLGGYLFSSIFIAACLGFSSLLSMIFFFPLWYAAIVLLVLYVMCLVCGTLPILTLLRRTPSEILAKYDI